jgi:hypothetical protein
MELGEGGDVGRRIAQEDGRGGAGEVGTEIVSSGGVGGRECCMPGGGGLVGAGVVPRRGGLGAVADGGPLRRGRGSGSGEGRGRFEEVGLGDGELGGGEDELFAGIVALAPGVEDGPIRGANRPVGGAALVPDEIALESEGGQALFEVGVICESLGETSREFELLGVGEEDLGTQLHAGIALEFEGGGGSQELLAEVGDCAVARNKGIIPEAESVSKLSAQAAVFGEASVVPAGEISLVEKDVSFLPELLELILEAHDNFDEVSASSDDFLSASSVADENVAFILICRRWSIEFNHFDDTRRSVHVMGGAVG